MIEFSLTSLDSDEAWRRVEARLRPFVARRSPSADVDDVLQDIYVRLQRGLPSLRDEQRFGSWVYRVARSAIADHLRRRPTLEDPIDAGSTEPTREEVELAACAGKFVSRLPSPYREALTLTYIEGRTQREAAKLLGVSDSGMKSRVQRGRERLRALLESCCHIELDVRNGIVDFEPR